MTTMHDGMAAKQNATPPVWLSRSRAQLLLDVLSGARSNFDKLMQLCGLLLAFVRPRLVRRRLERLKSLGHIEHVPNIPQMLVAARDQMILSAAEETKLFYRSQGIPWVFHNVRRFLSGPATMMDPVGLFSPRDAIIAHVLQTFHRHPVYDLVLLRAHESGVEELEAQTRAVLAGTHPSARALRSLIEDGSYHQRLLDEIAEFERDPHVAARPIPDGLVDDRHVMLGMDQFKDMRGFTAYASRLRVSAFDALRAWTEVGFNETVGSLLGRRLGPTHVDISACDAELVQRHLDPGARELSPPVGP